MPERDFTLHLFTVALEVAEAAEVAGVAWERCNALVSSADEVGLPDSEVVTPVP